MADENPYDPLDYANLGQSIATSMLAREVVNLRQLAAFTGAGIYAIYYTGAFQAYEALARRNRNDLFDAPIYVGKAVPAGARKGGRGTGLAGQALYKRLMDHAKSISQAENLDLDDFHCRYLVVADIWIPLSETLLIERTQPLWNVIVDGFGNHPPGSRRGTMQRPQWDTIHPRRPWAASLQPHRRSVAEILENVRRALAGEPVEKLPASSQAAEADTDA